MNHKLDNIKKTCFNIPKDYFQNLEDKIMNTISLDNSLEGTEATGFKVPEGYFDSLEDNILIKVNQVNETKVVSIFSKQNLIYISGVAAAVLIMFSVFWNSTETTIDNIDIDLVENYFIDQGINTYEIASLLSENDIFDLDLEIFDDNFNEDSLEKYLLENVELKDFIDQ